MAEQSPGVFENSVLDGLRGNPEWVADQAERTRRTQLLEPYYDAPEEEIVDRLYAEYAEMDGRITDRVECFDEAEVSLWLSGQQPGYTVADRKKLLDKEEVKGDYPFFAAHVEHMFWNSGRAQQDFTPVLAVIKTLRDPDLAHTFLERLRMGLPHYTPKDYLRLPADNRHTFDDPKLEPAQFQTNRQALLYGPQQAYFHALQRELYSDETKPLGALVIGAKALFPQFGIRKNAKRDVFEPLEEIAALPSLPVQLFWAALHGRTTGK